MSGILDNKTRIIDAIVTSEGRRQLAEGDMRIEYVSFTDAGTYYRADVVSGSADASSRIFFEACNLPQDQITFEADDSGKLMPFANALDVQLRAGNILSFSLGVPTSSIFVGSLEHVNVLSGTAFASVASNLLAESSENFKKLQ